MKKNKILIIIIFLSVLLTGVTVFAAGEVSMTYKQLLEVLFLNTGTSPAGFKQPTPSFDLKLSNGKTISVSPSAPGLYDEILNPDAVYDIPIHETTIPIGTVIQGIDTSTVGEGSSINKWDWQVAYWDTKGAAIPGAYQEFSSKNVSVTADKEGYMLFFLNVADNYAARDKDTNKILPFENWSNKGNWVTNGNKTVGTIQVEDWYFTVVKIKVSGNDMGMKEPVELISSTGSSVNSYLKDQPYRLRFNMEHIMGDTDIGLDPTNNPKPTIDITVKDANSNVILSQTLQSPNNLLVGNTLTMPLSNSFSTNTHFLEACATINKVHADKGWNADASNDTICKRFNLAGVDIGMDSGVKMYNMSGVRIDTLMSR